MEQDGICPSRLQCDPLRGHAHALRRADDGFPWPLRPLPDLTLPGHAPALLRPNKEAGLAAHALQDQGIFSRLRGFQEALPGKAFSVGKGAAALTVAVGFGAAGEVDLCVHGAALPQRIVRRIHACAAVVAGKPRVHLLAVFVKHDAAFKGSSSSTGGGLRPHGISVLVQNSIGSDKPRSGTVCVLKQVVGGNRLPHVVHARIGREALPGQFLQCFLPGVHPAQNTEAPFLRLAANGVFRPQTNQDGFSVSR